MPTLVPTVLRLNPGDDLRDALEGCAYDLVASALFVIAGIGSLRIATIRFAGAAQPEALEGDWEITSLSGTVSPDDSHLHIVVAGSDGTVLGGHVSKGCVVRTTAEILVAKLDGLRFSREDDPATGYRELKIESDG